MVNEEAGTRTGEGLQDREDVRRLARTLTDDRQDPDLLVFEKTWGHRLLAGLSVGMLVAALVFVVFCAWNLYGLASSLGVQGMHATFGFVLYTAGIAAGVVVIPPALLGVYVAKHPQAVLAAIVAPLVAFALLVGFVLYASTVPGAQLFSVALFTGVGAVFPLLYLVAAVQIRRS